MNKEQIMEAMNYIDPALVEEADRNGTQCARNRWRRPAVIAACLCLVLAGTALASSGVRLTWVDSDSEAWLRENDVIYTFDMGMAWFPLDSFSGAVTGLAAEYRNDTAARAFDSWDELEEYLGVDIFDNPVLDGAARGPACRYAGMGIRDRATNILLLAHFNDRGLTGVSANGSYLIEGIWVRPGAQLYTELMREPAEAYAEEHGTPAPGFVTGGEDVEMSMEELYTTPGGLEVTITRRVSSELGMQATSYYAHFSLNGTGCQIIAQTSWDGRALGDPPDDPAHTLEVLKKVLDGFVPAA